MDLAPACSNIRLNVKKQTLKRIYVPQKKKGEKNTSQSKLPRITKNRRHTIQIFAFDETTWHNDNKQVIIYIERNFWKRILQCFSSLFRLMKHAKRSILQHLDFQHLRDQVNLPVRIFPGMIVSYLRHSSLEKGRRLAREIRKEESAFNRGDASVETVEPRLTWDLW